MNFAMREVPEITIRNTKGDRLFTLDGLQKYSYSINVVGKKEISFNVLSAVYPDGFLEFIKTNTKKFYIDIDWLYRNCESGEDLHRIESILINDADLKFSGACDGEPVSFLIRFNCKNFNR